MTYDLRKTDENVMIAERAISELRLGKGVNIWYGAVLRGDMGPITVGEDTNIQDRRHPPRGDRGGQGLHHRPRGHRPWLHGGGQHPHRHGSHRPHGARIGSDCIVGAGALVTGKMDAPDGSMILGSPAKVVRPLTAEEIESNRISMEEYLEAAARYRKERETR